MKIRATVAGTTTIKLPHNRLNRKFANEGVIDYCPLLVGELLGEIDFFILMSDRLLPPFWPPIGSAL